MAEENVAGLAVNELDTLSSNVDKLLTEQTPLQTVPQSQSNEKPAGSEPGKETTPPAGTTVQSKENQPPQEQTSGTQAQPPASAAPGAEKLLAGKYKTENDLVNGIFEENRVVKGDLTPLLDLIEEARRTKDYSKAEAKYKELQTSATAKIAEEKKNLPPSQPQEQVQKPAQDKQPALPEQQLPSPKEMETMVTSQVAKELASSALAKKFEAKGVRLPENQEELDAIEEDYPTLYVQYIREQDRLTSEVRQRGEAFLKVEREAPTHNEQQRTEARTQITEFAKRYGKEMNANEVNAIIKEIENKGDVWTSNLGVPYLEKGGIFRYFKAEKGIDFFDTHFQRAIADTKNQTAQATANLIEEFKKVGIKSVSTIAIPGSGSQARQPSAIDWTKSEDRDMASEIALAAEIDRRLGKD